MTHVNKPIKKYFTRKAKRILLVKRGLSVAELARRIEVSRQWTSYALYGLGGSSDVRAAIAKELGVSVSSLWKDAA